MLKVQLPTKFQCQESKNKPITENRVLEILLERDQKILELEEELATLRNKLDTIQSFWILRKIFKW